VGGPKSYDSTETLVLYILLPLRAEPYTSIYTKIDDYFYKCAHRFPPVSGKMWDVFVTVCAVDVSQIFYSINLVRPHAPVDLVLSYPS
jgi:hypothetical protein